MSGSIGAYSQSNLNDIGAYEFDVTVRTDDNAIGAYISTLGNSIGAYAKKRVESGTGGSVWSLARHGGLAGYGGLAGMGGGLAGASNMEDPFTHEQVTEAPKRR